MARTFARPLPLTAAFRRWLFRLGPDSDLPIILTQRRIFILPTGAGVLYGVVLIVMLIGAINYNLSLGHALVFLLMALGLVAMVHTFRNLLGLRLTPGPAEAVFAGETARFPLFVENPRRHARYALELHFDGAGETLRLDEIPAGEQRLAVIAYPAIRRGRLVPGRITLASRFPLGLFRTWCYPHPPFSCLVYPKPIDSPLPLPLAAAQSGEQPGKSGLEDFAGLRERQPNESPRHIAWKAVARDADHRPLLVKQFDGGGVDEIRLDWAMTDPGLDTETRLSQLAGWIVAAERRQQHYGLRLPGREIAPGHGRLHRDTCLEALALYGD
ncbi:DUF58 domain-containing protein [Propionivibrio limicola]|uniref:DUF58 domain-containing protein n=1 Tax=Propionivibrio limicola TaxID=167645 RepID=UPI00129289A8|nr:DUF58 domain-containing protein [Propionivibrio limicola]